MAETSAALLWPFRFVWVDPETVTSLVEAHGATPEAIVRAAYGGQPGFPILIPVALVDRLAALSGQHGEEAVQSLAAAGVTIRQIELGDPGIVHDMSTSRGDLPRYQGPPEPAGGPPPDWNSALAAQACRITAVARVGRGPRPDKLRPRYLIVGEGIGKISPTFVNVYVVEMLSRFVPVPSLASVQALKVA